MLAHEVADAAAQRDPPDTYRASVPEARREAVGARRSGVFPRGQAGLGPRGAPLEVDLERLNLREVEHDPPFGGAVTGGAVAAALDGELQPTLARERHHARDVGCVLRPDDERWPAVDPAVENGARLVVVPVPGAYQLAPDVGGKLP